MKSAIEKINKARMELGKIRILKGVMYLTFWWPMHAL